MIALRRTIERGVRHPLFGPLCLILLALLLVFTVIHGAHDQIHNETGLMVCLAIVITALLSLLVPRIVVARFVTPRASRAPPQQHRCVRVPVRPLLRSAPVPLRL